MSRRLQAAIYLIGALMASSAVAATPTDRFTVLSQAEVKHMTFCSRPGPKITGAWDPTVQDVLDLESKLGEVAKLKASDGQQIPHPQEYFRQYLGVIVDGRKVIYTNAFRNGIGSDRWRKKFIGVCDGGKLFWGALYDPNTKAFSDLEVNGFA